MRALICRAWGSIDGLTVEEIAPPAPAADEVLIDVRATSVNYADSIMVAGKYQTKPPLPFSPGLETAGVVAACGASVTRFKAGDRVMATLAWGGLAEQAVAKESETFAIPAGMSFEEAGAFPIAYISSDVAIRWQGRLEAGETLLVLGAAGGVGLTAVEIGKAMGARVIAGVSTAEKLAVAREHGADDGINYTSENLTERVMALTGDRGADVCFDPIGGELPTPRFLPRLGGRMLLVGFVGGVQQIPANRLLSRTARRSAAPCATYRLHEPPSCALGEALVGWYGAGKLKPHVSHRLPLERSVEAIRLLTDRRRSARSSSRSEPEPWRSASPRTARRDGRHIDNQPRLNAMSRAMMADLGRIWDELERGSCRAIVLTGAGPRAFCAGPTSAAISALPRTPRAWWVTRSSSRTRTRSRSWPRSTATAWAAAWSCCSPRISARRPRTPASACPR